MNSPEVLRVKELRRRARELGVDIYRIVKLDAAAQQREPPDDDQREESFPAASKLGAY